MYRPYILNALQNHRALKPLSAHMPGHKNGSLLPPDILNAWGAEIFSYDVTELDGLDDLHRPEGIIAQSQQQAAAIFHAKEVHYLINGSTCGLHAALLSVARGEEIFIPRHAHRSIYYGLMLAGAKPIYLPITPDPDWGIPLGVNPSDLKKAIEEHPSCHNLLIVNPTYQGITWKNAELIKLAKANGLSVIVDEAHGAHLTFHDALPASLLDLGADLVVQSWHKTLPAITGTSALLVGESYRGPDVSFALDVLQSTSPSYLMLCSLEAASIYMAEHGQEDIERSLAEINTICQETAALKTLTVLHNPTWRQDPFKLNLASKALSGQELAHKLSSRHIYVEMSEANSALLMLPLKITADYRQRLLTSLKQIDRECQNLAPKERTSPFYLRDIPPVRCPLAHALWQEKESIPLSAALNRTCGTFVLRYPPGIPLAVPGEVITRPLIELLRPYPEWQSITVLKEPH